METKQGRRIYSREFEQEAVRLVRASDQSLAAVARDLGIDGNILRKWQHEEKQHGVEEVDRVAIWGNHSATQFPDFFNARIGGKPATKVISDSEHLHGEFLSTIQKRGAAIIAAQVRRVQRPTRLSIRWCQ